MRLQRREAIERQAEAILQRTGQINGQVDIFEVARKLGAVVQVQHMEDEISGVLVVSQDQKFILVNEDQALVRQRFSVAHELGHLVLHDTSPERMFVDGGVRLYQRVGQPSSANYRGPDSHTTPDEEREANHFAAAILMPEPAVRAYAFGKTVLEDLLVEEMARYFDVSVQAMSIRLQRLNILEPSDVF